MIIDFHVHCFPDELAPKAVKALTECSGVQAQLDGTVANVKESMRNAGINHSVVLSIATRPAQTEKINTWSAQIQDKSITAFGSIHPDYNEWARELKRIKELGLKGIKFHPDYQNFFVDELRMFKVYELACELDLIIIFHAGVDIGLPAPYKCTPDRLLKVVKEFPGAKIAAAHMGGYSYWDEVERKLVGEDVYFDTSYSIGWMDSAQLKRILRNHDNKKILFATDSPWTNQHQEILKIKELGLDTNFEESILGKNAAMLLGLDYLVV